MLPGNVITGWSVDHPWPDAARSSRTCCSHVQYAKSPITRTSARNWHSGAAPHCTSCTRTSRIDIAKTSTTSEPPPTASGRCSMPSEK
jgi:hypothetical protein